MFIELLSFNRSLVNIANVFNFTTCISLNNQPCITQPTLLGLNPGKYNRNLHYYPFIVNLNKCNGSYNSLDDPSGRI